MPLLTTRRYAPPRRMPNVLKEVAVRGLEVDPGRKRLRSGLETAIVSVPYTIWHMIEK